MNGQPLSPAVREHIAAGRKIDAIKTLRAETGLDLKSAVERVDAHIRSDPALAAADSARQVLLRQRARWVLLIAAGLVACAAALVFATP